MITIGINPVAFSLGDFSLRWYSIMVALATAVVVAWTLWTAKKVRFPEQVILTTAIWGIIGGVTGARLVHVIDQLDYYVMHPTRIIGREGLSIYGAVLGAALAIWLYSRVRHFPFGRLADLIAPGAILGQAIGRVGCTINGCCYGKPTSLPWSFVYTHPDTYAPLGVAVHPTQVYELLWDLVVFGILWRLRGKLRPDGSLFLLYLALFSLGRFFITFVREGTVLWGGLLQAHIISILVLMATVPLLAVRTRLKEKAMLLPDSDPEK